MGTLLKIMYNEHIIFLVFNTIETVKIIFRNFVTRKIGIDMSEIKKENIVRHRTKLRRNI